MKNLLKKSCLTLVLVLLSACLVLSACSKPAEDNNSQANNQPPTEIVLATTTSTYDSGLLDYLLPIFQEKHNIKVNVVSVGTGEAIKNGENGDADVILVHARAKEDQFVTDGFGIERQDVMYNQFLLVGPAEDPAKVKESTDLNSAMKGIADSKAPFISRGDQSGTHTKELGLWKAAEITPAGDWYVEAGLGMGDTLTMANEKNAYTLTDEATYLAMKDKFNLIIVREGDEALLNPYGVILINPEKHPDTKIDAARTFANFLTSAEGQELIGKFGVEQYGKALFTPSAAK